MPGAQRLRDTPGLRNAATRRVRCVTVENLADRAQARCLQVRRQARQQRMCLRDIGMDTVVREHERAEQPAPNRALVIRRVTLAWTARVAPAVSGVPRRQAA